MDSSDRANDPTLPPSQALPDTVRATSEPSPSAAQPLQPSGYELGEQIGRGGMGEVLLARDRRIGREVAIKRLLRADPDEEDVARFLREARIQACLDHPAIVPVHELGNDAEGRPYFTMKRLSGTTLLHMLGQTGVPQQRLLRAFAEVCLAIELAHSRGVVHRDLKPANMMLGDFGEVYVLDWGVARVLSELVDNRGAPSNLGPDAMTQVGAILGTPGYMPPEQALGEPVGPAADVYALGAILFEILTREPLHPRGHAAITSTIEGTPVSPAGRRPDLGIAPELDAACVAALAREPSARPSARELGERVQRYLDGDRDVERRRALAAEQLERARSALAKGDRSTAMSAGGRALALDPESTAAAALVTKLMIEPPPVPPPELRAELGAADAEAVTRHARTTSFSYLSMFGMVPILLWNGVLGWEVLLALLGLAVVLASVAWQIARRPRRTLREMVFYQLGNAALLALVARLCGPLVLTPALACMMIMSAISYPLFAARPWVLFAVILPGWFVPVLLERIGWMASTWGVVDGAVVATSHAIHLGGASTIVFVFGASLLTIMIAVFHAGALARANLEAQHQLVTQAWQLRQLLPVPQT
jgi:serine/threonine protein kinase